MESLFFILFYFIFPPVELEHVRMYNYNIIYPYITFIYSTPIKNVYTYHYVFSEKRFTKQETGIPPMPMIGPPVRGRSSSHQNRPSGTTTWGPMSESGINQQATGPRVSSQIYRGYLHSEKEKKKGGWLRGDCRCGC